MVAAWLERGFRRPVTEDRRLGARADLRPGPLRFPPVTTRRPRLAARTDLRGPRFFPRAAFRVRAALEDRFRLAPAALPRPRLALRRRGLGFLSSSAPMARGIASRALLMFFTILFVIVS